MDYDGHYYMTKYAARISGFPDKDAELVASASLFVDYNGKDLIKHPLRLRNTGDDKGLGYPLLSTQFDDGDYVKTFDPSVWAIFHFLPGNHQNANGNKRHIFRTARLDGKGNITGKEVKLASYLTRPNSQMIEEMHTDTRRAWEQLKGTNYEKSGLMLMGIRVHVLCDSYAHQDFSGLNAPHNGVFNLKGIDGCQLPAGMDDAKHAGSGGNIMDSVIYSAKIMGDNGDEQQLAPSGFNYGHGQAGHLPDVSGLVFEYSPEWDKQLRLKRNNPKEFSEAFLDLVKMFKRLRTGRDFHVSFGEKKSYEDKIFVPNEVYEVISKYRRFGRKQDGVFHKVALDWQNLFYSSNFNFKPYSGNYDWEEGFKKEWMEGTEHNHKEVVVSETCSYMRFQYALCHHVDWAINALNRKVSVTNKPMSKYIDEGENYVKSRKIRKHCCDRLDLADFELPGGIYSIEPAAARGKFLQLSTDSNAPLDRPLLRLVPEEPHRWFIKQSPNHDGYYRLFNKDQQGFSLDALKANEDSSAPVEFANVDYSSEDQLWKIKVINRDNNGVTAFLINKASGKAFCYQEHGPTQLTLEEIPNEAAKFNIQFFPGEHIPEKTGALLDGIF